MEVLANRWIQPTSPEMEPAEVNTSAEHFRGVHRRWRWHETCQCNRRSFVTRDNWKHEFSMSCTICTVNDCHEPRHKLMHGKLIGLKNETFFEGKFRIKCVVKILEQDVLSSISFELSAVLWTRKEVVRHQWPSSCHTCKARDVIRLLSQNCLFVH